MASVKLSKSYKDTFEMLADKYPDHPEYAENAFLEYERQKVSNELFIIRNRAGLTQAEVAERIGVSQSTIAKWEDRGDQLRFNDFLRYVHSLGFGVRMQLVREPINRASTIKYHLESVAALMEELEDVAADDPDISQGIVKTFIGQVRRMLDTVIPKWLSKIAPLREGDAAPHPQQSLLIETQADTDVPANSILAANVKALQ